MAEASKNLTDYENTMTPILDGIESTFEYYLDNYNEAEICVESWKEARNEFDGYMSVISAFGIAQTFIASDLAIYEAYLTSTGA